MKILVDEMYPATVAGALVAAGIEATTVADLRLAGASDPEVFGAAVAGGYSVLTGNVGDFAPLAAEHSTAGGHHHGVLIALSSRFSPRPAAFAPARLAPPQSQTSACSSDSPSHQAQKLLASARIDTDEAVQCGRAT